jgi:hypothetical protein
MTTISIDKFKDDGNNQELTANICRNSAMEQYACTNAAQCWEPCGELGHSAEHAIIGDEQALLLF